MAVLAMINTPDPDRLATFWSTLFDATTTDRQPPEGEAFYIGLRLGDDGELGIVRGAADDGSAPGSAGRILLSVDVADVDGLLDRVTELGGTVLGPPNDMPWGQRVAHVTDPDGNPVNLTQQL